jgi:hypothetical protein
MWTNKSKGVSITNLILKHEVNLHSRKKYIDTHANILY